VLGPARGRAAPLESSPQLELLVARAPVPLAAWAQARTPGRARTRLVAPAPLAVRAHAWLHPHPWPLGPHTLCPVALLRSLPYLWRSRRHEAWGRRGEAS